MRKWIDLFEAMSPAEARQVFFQLGVSTRDLDPAGLKSAYRKLMMQHHPDRGGDVAVAQELSSAYDVLKDAPTTARERKPDEPARGPDMAKEDFHDLNYVRAWFEEKTKGVPSQQWTVTNFDGHFFRGMFTIRGNHELFPDMARVMRTWDRFYDCRAILVGTRSMLENGSIALIWADGQEIKPMITLEFDSPNLNPANDQRFCRKLPHILDLVKADEFVSQSMIN